MALEQIKTFSPQELAQVIGVSESSVRRWVDGGLIDVTRTAGGHRRIPLDEALRFIRHQAMHIRRPELLGLPDLQELPPEARDGTLTDEVLFHLLRQGEAARARGLLTYHYLSGMPLAALFDEVIGPALARFGELWRHGEEGIYLEHLATSLCFEAVSQIRMLIPAAPPQAPVALGGSAARDPYLLPSLMAATLLADLGFRTFNLGPDTPPAAFLHAAEQHRPDLVWVAVTAHLDAGQVEAFGRELLEPLGARPVEVVVGGRGAARWEGRWPASVHVLPSMQALASFGQACRQRHA